MADFALARRRMVDSQLRTNKVVDPDVLAAFAEVPREIFVDPASRAVAYIDEDIPLGGGRRLMEPRVLARLLQALEVDRGDVALCVGCGTGYSSAVLARLAATVVALESDPALAARANENLAALAIDNVAVVEGPLAEGYPSQGPFDAIFIDGAVAEVPQALFDQLAEGGRLGAVIDDGAGPGRAMLYLRAGGVVSGRPLFDAAVPLLPGFEPKAGFVF